MNSFAYLLGVSILFAVMFVSVITINRMLAEQDKIICYIGMVVIDVLQVISCLTYILRLCGIL